jgi:8-oxo-dGTP diphosphatase
LEELGLDLAAGLRLLAVDWVPPRPERSEGMIFVFDGGVLGDEQCAGIVLDAERGAQRFEPGGERVQPVHACR